MAQKTIVFIEFISWNPRDHVDRFVGTEEGIMADTKNGTEFGLHLYKSSRHMEEAEVQALNLKYYESGLETVKTIEDCNSFLMGQPVKKVNIS
jgi:hypothetical protein